MKHYENVTTKVLRRQYDGKDITVGEVVTVITKDGNEYIGNLTNINLTNIEEATIEVNLMDSFDDVVIQIDSIKHVDVYQGDEE